MSKIKHLILCFLATILIITSTPIYADNHIHTTSPQITNISNSLQIEQLAATKKKSATVYITKTGEKYHKSGCRYLKQSKIAIDLTKAKKQGYTACKVCKPPK